MLSYLLDTTQQNPLTALIGLFLFFSLFIFSIIWTIKRDKDYIEKMRSLPLDSTDQNGDNHHD